VRERARERERKESLFTYLYIIKFLEVFVLNVSFGVVSVKERLEGRKNTCLQTKNKKKDKN